MLDLMNAAITALAGGALVSIGLECALQLWERWRDRRENPPAVRQPPRRAGKVFPDESDIEIVLEIVNGRGALAGNSRTEVRKDGMD